MDSSFAGEAPDSPTHIYLPAILEKRLKQIKTKVAIVYILNRPDTFIVDMEQNMIGWAQIKQVIIVKIFKKWPLPYKESFQIFSHHPLGMGNDLKEFR